MAAFDISILTNQYNATSNPSNPSNSKFKNLFSAFDFWFQKCISTFMGTIRTILSICSNSNFKNLFKGIEVLSCKNVLYIYGTGKLHAGIQTTESPYKTKTMKTPVSMSTWKNREKEELQATSSCWGEEPVLSRDKDPDWLSNPKESALNTCTWEQH